MLDEIQMMADPGRGWGWTRAFLGIPAATLHVCGAPEALPLIQRMAEECGDELTVRTHCNSHMLCECITPYVLQY